MLICQTILRNKIIKTVTVLGLDPGLASLGWGVVRKSGTRLFYIAHGCITTQASDPSCERIGAIRNALHKIIETYHPSALAVENLFFSRNVTSALNVAEVRGIIKLLAFDFTVPLYEYTPIIIKQAVCGSGRAGKEEVGRFVALILGLTDIPEPDHAADALGAAICCINNSLPAG